MRMRYKIREILPSGVTKSLFFWYQTFIWGGGGGGQEDGIPMKGAQSKVKWGAHGVNWGGGALPPGPPIVSPLIQPPLY